MIDDHKGSSRQTTLVVWQLRKAVPAVASSSEGVCPDKNLRIQYVVVGIQN